MIRWPVVVAFLLGVFLTLTVFVTAFFIGEATATRRGGILVSAAALATRTPTPAETATLTPTDTPTEVPTDTPTPLPTATPVPPTATPVPVTPTPTVIVERCSGPKDTRIGLGPLRSDGLKVSLSKGQSIRVSIAAYGYDRSLEFSIVDPNGTELRHGRLVGTDSTQFTVPYSGTYQLKIVNPSWFGRKTVDLGWQVCGV